MGKKIINNVPIDKIVKSFSNKYRIKIIELLEKNPQASVADIATKLNKDIKIISFHLSILAGAGLIDKKYQGTTVLHKLSTRGKLILKFLRILE